MRLILDLTPEQADRFVRLSKQEGENDLVAYAIELIEGSCDELLDEPLDGEIEDFLEI